MDFVLVSDVLKASEARYAPARRNIMGAKAGSYSVFLEASGEILLIEPSELDWNAALKKHVFSMGDAFVVSRTHVAEPSAIGVLKACFEILSNYLLRSSNSRRSPHQLEMDSNSATTFWFFSAKVTVGAQDYAIYQSRGSKSIRSLALTLSALIRFGKNAFSNDCSTAY